MASLEFSQTQVFASATARAATRLAYWYPSAASGGPLGQPGAIGLIQLERIPYFQRPPPGSGIATTSGTWDLTATAPDSRVNNRSGEHGPFGLSLPRDQVQALPEVERAVWGAAGADRAWLAGDIKDEAGVPFQRFLQYVACLMYIHALNLLLVITR